LIPRGAARHLRHLALAASLVDEEHRDAIGAAQRRALPRPARVLKRGAKA
tara:strand:- start:270 stop:419 length:150 start_codon:yes stop_codon:yes gene_type:complete